MKNVSLRVTSRIDKNSDKKKSTTTNHISKVSHHPVRQATPFDSKGFRKDLLGEIYSYIDSKIEFL